MSDRPLWTAGVPCPPSDPSIDWLVLQLADSAFPIGGFAHSNGLEAAMQLGEIDGANFQPVLQDVLWQTGHAVMPLLSDAHESPERLPELDRLCNAFLTNHVSNRASRLQGRAFLSTCERCFPVVETQLLREAARKDGLHQHFAPVFGATLKLLDVSLQHAQQLALFMALRSCLSAAVRLGIIGPQQAQQLQFQNTALLDNVFDECSALRAAELAQTAPMLDLFQGMHDRLYSRLFQS